MKRTDKVLSNNQEIPVVEIQKAILNFLIEKGYPILAAKQATETMDAYLFDYFKESNKQKLLQPMEDAG